MKKTIVITCVGGLMGAALWNAAADEPAVNTSPRVRSLYFDASPDGPSAQPDWMAGPTSTAAESETAVQPEEEISDIVAAGGFVADEGQSDTVMHANEECTAEDTCDVIQVQGLRTLPPNEERLTRPISTSPAESSVSSFPAAPAAASRTADDFSWAAPNSRNLTQPPTNPFANRPENAGTSVETSPLPAMPTVPTQPEAAPAAVPSRLTVSNRAPAGSRTVVPSSFTAPAAVTQSSSPDVRLEWRSGGEINVGQETTCLLTVHNHGNTDAVRVDVTAVFPGSVRLLGAEPVPDQSQSLAEHKSQLTWQIERLSPGSESVFEVTLIPLARGEIATEAEVRFSSQSSGLFAVSEPMIDVTIEGPGSVMVGEPATQVVTISNPGTGIATHVELEAIIPQGLEHSRGERLLMDLGSLNPGESRSVRLALAATDGGVHTVQVQARADANLSHSAASQVNVISPNLITRIDGPGLRYLGRQAVYTLSVINDGSVPTDNVRVMHKVPEGFRFVNSDRGAQFDEANNLINWFVGRLDQGQSAELQVTLEAAQAGEFTHFIRATSENGAVSDAQVSTTVEATSSLALELRDIDDPVELGTEAAYEITVRNEGTAAATNVTLWCELPAGVEFTSGSGPAGHLVENGAVRFQPLAQLAPGETATFRVLVQAGVLGNHRLRAHLSSDSLSEPLTDEEVTKFYGE